jgi:hypothetical protein
VVDVRAEATGRATLRRIIEQMRADPDAVDGVVAAARAQSAPVRSLPLQEVQRHIAGMIGAVANAFLDSGGIGPYALAADRLAGDRAVQGVPLAALLDGFQAGRAYMLYRLIEDARTVDLPTNTLLDALVELDGYTNELQNRLIHAYRETELSLTRTAHAARAQALRDLLHNGPPARIVDAGLDVSKRYHCWVADLTDPTQVRRVETVLTTPDGISGLVDGYLCGVTAALPAEQALNGALNATLVVAAPAVTPDALAGCYRLCAAALKGARSRGLTGLRPLTSLAVAVAVDGHPQLGEMLVAERLAGLDRSDEFHRLLAGTALSYLEHGSRVDLAAVALHVHPNTVKHRLRRLGELTSFDAAPRPAEALTEALGWWWSLRTWLAGG